MRGGSIGRADFTATGRGSGLTGAAAAVSTTGLASAFGFAGGLAAATCAPRFMRLTGKFNVRGGLYTTVTAEHRAPGFSAQPPVALP